MRGREERMQKMNAVRERDEGKLVTNRPTDRDRERSVPPPLLPTGSNSAGNRPRVKKRNRPESSRRNETDGLTTPRRNRPWNRFVLYALARAREERVISQVRRRP